MRLYWEICILLLLCLYFTRVDSFYANSTEIVAVRLSPKSMDFLHPQKIAELHGYIHLGQIGTLAHYHIFKKSKSWTPSHPELISHPLVEMAEIQRPLNRSRRVFSSPLDPLYSRQWHLHTITGYPNAPHVNAIPVWELGIKGSGVTVAIVDDGLQTSHPDLQNNYNPSGSWDFMDDKNNPSPIMGDSHGTSASGCVGAGANSACGVGAAFESSISGLRIMKGDNGVNDAGEGAALSYKCQTTNHIYTCSWGPYDDAKRLEGPGTVARAAMESCIKNGRGGKGSIYVWACGNGAQNSDNINYDGYANNRYTIAIGAVTDGGSKGYYSEPGAPLMAVTPSSGGKQGITSTSIHGGQECTSTFGGTSAASPIAAGVIALILQANSQLGWRDVQHIIVRTSRHTGVSSNSWVVNGAGFKHSLELGYGLLDAEAAVKLAKTWKNVPADQKEELAQTYSGGADKISSGQEKQYTFSVKNKRDFHVEHVEVHVVGEGSTKERGRMSIGLTSPANTFSPLQESHVKDVNTKLDWSYWSVRHWEEDPNGTWTVKIKNDGSKDAKVTSIKVTIYGYVQPRNIVILPTGSSIPRPQHS